MQQASERRARLNSGSSRSRANSTAAGRAVGATIKTGSPQLEPRPGERQADARLPRLRRRAQDDDPPAAPGHVEHLALPRETAIHGSPRPRPGRDSQRAIRPRAVGSSPGFGAFLDGRRVSAIAPALRFLALISARPIRARVFGVLGQRYHAVTTGP